MGFYFNCDTMFSRVCSLWFLLPLNAFLAHGQEEFQKLINKNKHRVYTDSGPCLHAIVYSVSVPISLILVLVWWMQFCYYIKYSEFCLLLRSFGSVRWGRSVPAIRVTLHKRRDYAVIELTAAYHHACISQSSFPQFLASIPSRSIGSLTKRSFLLAHMF